MPHSGGHVTTVETSQSSRQPVSWIIIIVGLGLLGAVRPHGGNPSSPRTARPHGPPCRPTCGTYDQSPTAVRAWRAIVFSAGFTLGVGAFAGAADASSNPATASSGTATHDATTHPQSRPRPHIRTAGGDDVNQRACP